MSTPRYDAITIFPDYMAPLQLSLIGKAADKGLLKTVVADLRSFANGVHKSVDDTPYGGGAGMVMSPVPWGEAIDSVAADAESEGLAQHTLIVLTPAGEKFNQAIAEELSTKSHLIFACGRYEGIDYRVTEHYRNRENFVVREVSIGDYVLGGGEVATLVILEAVIRLIPGVLGNAASIVEESHSLKSEDGSESLVEYPNFTKPPRWRDLDVPEELLSGNHALIASWRAKQAQERTEKLKEQTRE